LTVLFPDSTFSFAPFEYDSKSFFPTVSKEGESFDSVVYFLTTFEIDPIQKLLLPVFVVAKRDCTEHRAQLDSIRLISLVKTPPPDTVQAQNLPLKVDTTYEKVLQFFNYPILVIVSVGLVILLMVGWIIFGKRIMKYIRVKRLTRQFKDFQSSFHGKLEIVRTEFTPEMTEQILSIWKKYLERLERKPFTKLTTRETIQMEKDPALGESLKKLDMAIYGHNQSVVDPLLAPEQVAEKRFELKLEEVMNG
jgi:hypothetical protein